MDLYEFEGKALLAQHSVPTPKSAMVYSDAAPAPLPYPFVLKAQVLTGGRGKAGGVRVCKDEAEYRKNAAEMLGMSIKGHKVNGLLCEERVAAEQEYYLSITLQGVDRPTLIVSRSGGMEIEEIARSAPEKIIRERIDPFTGLKEYQLNRVIKTIAPKNIEGFRALVRGVERAFMDMKAILVEINPLGAVGDSFVAMDSKIVLDDHAQGMRDAMDAMERARLALPNYVAKAKEQTTITFVPLGEGDVGLISDGAGTGMLTLDLIADAGGKVASFCELGGTTNADVMYKAMDYTLTSGRRPRSVIVVLIGGFNRMDDMANGITAYMRDHAIDVPVYTRMCGTMQEEGIEIMRRAGLSTMDDLMETVQAAVRSSKEIR
jgi:succinyl-CoA synthetase beta subunit